jgi:acyl-CoA reductase-like NAD-dependent aldehyde dehydrogenase
MGAASKDRPGPDPDRLIVAQIHGAAQRHARWREPTEAETAAAVEELREIARDRRDLLAEVAGILTGAAEGTVDE